MRGFPLVAIHKDAAGDLPRAAALSVLPEVAEARWRKLGISNRVLDVLVPEIMLQSPRVVTVIGEFEAAGVAEHVGMDGEWHLRRLPEPRNHPAEGNRAHGRSPLAQEQVTAWLLLALKSTQGAQFGAGERVDRGYAALEPGNVQSGMGKIDLLPAEGAQLGRSQAVPEG